MLAFFMYDPFNNPLALLPAIRIGRKKNHSYAILTSSREFKSFPFTAIY